MIDTKCYVYAQPAVIRGVYHHHAHSVRVSTYEVHLPMLLLSDETRQFPTEEQAMRFAEATASQRVEA